MANKKSVQKAHRGSLRKQKNNLFWKSSVSSAKKAFMKVLADKDSTTDILTQKEINLQKTLDKAAKVKAIHKNKASRLKSRYAKKLTAQSSVAVENPSPKSTGAKKPRGRPAKSK
ncbi:MAG: 30S ribosomal protein S20 [Patescibacteria group bacterium]|jgi:ribosomal protein S20